MGDHQHHAFDREYLHKPIRECDNDAPLHLRAASLDESKHRDVQRCIQSYLRVQGCQGSPIRVLINV